MKGSSRLLPLNLILDPVSSQTMAQHTGYDTFAHADASWVDGAPTDLEDDPYHPQPLVSPNTCLSALDTGEHGVPINQPLSQNHQLLYQHSENTPLSLQCRQAFDLQQTPLTTYEETAARRRTVQSQRALTVNINLHSWMHWLVKSGMRIVSP